MELRTAVSRVVMFDREKNGGDGERGGVLIEMRPSNTMVLLGEILTFYTFSPLAFMGGEYLS